MERGSAHAIIWITLKAMEVIRFTHPALIFIFLIHCYTSLSLNLDVDERAINEATTLECHVREYKYTVTKETILKPDGRILECSGQVVVDSCWGRCDSSEIPDFKVPYKLSDHPVCTYGEISRRIVNLDNCHPDYPHPEHEVIDAVWCSCSVCTGNDTSCQTLNS
ncbi:hypothetical protein LSH36_8g02017 [Paralvinella palmiformis]|uniref:Glycoprotein hormone subunit beta domain-containing protein n=1 Tax=Paralvinella palmiformis TaxID=53620 RepID=A0AAD9NGW5_9ANNE|nr:hypothetical protein LSH36_8g02017 [Paralvinella palmiformis]